MVADDEPLLTPIEAVSQPKASARRVEAEEYGEPPTSEPEEGLLLTPEAERCQAVARAPLHGGAGGDTAASDARNGKRKMSSDCLSDALVRNDSIISMSVPARASKYRKIKKVGTGAYGAVYMAENMETKEIVAVKETTRKEDPIYGGFPVSLLREIGILQRLRHPNIVQLHEVAQTERGDALIIMEYCQSSLLELLNSRKHNLSFSEVKYVVRQVLDATRHMHERGILHRDLATKNVLFNISGEIKVCDFGISRVAFGQDEEHGFILAKGLEDPNMIVSLPYRAIELLLGQRDYGPALDVWAAGCIMGEILLCQGGNRRTFFGGDRDNPNRTPQSTIEEIFLICGTPTEDTWPRFPRLPLLKQFLSGGLRLERRSSHGGPGEERGHIRRFFNLAGKCANSKYSLTEACFDLLGGLLALCPDQRLTAAAALDHSFFRERPTPEWHAWHWKMDDSEIPRGDDIRRQEKDGGDEARTLLRKLSQVSQDPESKEDGAPKSLKEQTKEVLQRRASQNKLIEEKRLAAMQDKKSVAAAANEKLPPGWTKHWSKSQQRHYYHDKKNDRTQWYPPAAPKK